MARCSSARRFFKARPKGYTYLRQKPVVASGRFSVVPASRTYESDSAFACSFSSFFHFFPICFSISNFLRELILNFAIRTRYFVSLVRFRVYAPFDKWRRSVSGSKYFCALVPFFSSFPLSIPLILTKTFCNKEISFKKLFLQNSCLFFY